MYLTKKHFLFAVIIGALLIVLAIFFQAGSDNPTIQRQPQITKEPTTTPLEITPPAQNIDLLNIANKAQLPELPPSLPIYSVSTTSITGLQAIANRLELGEPSFQTRTDLKWFGSSTWELSISANPSHAWLLNTQPVTTSPAPDITTAQNVIESKIQELNLENADQNINLRVTSTQFISVEEGTHPQQLTQANAQLTQVSFEYFLGDTMLLHSSRHESAIVGRVNSQNQLHSLSIYPPPQLSLVRQVATPSQNSLIDTINQRRFTYVATKNTDNYGFETADINRTILTNIYLGHLVRNDTTEPILILEGYDDDNPNTQIVFYQQIL